MSCSVRKGPKETERESSNLFANCWSDISCLCAAMQLHNSWQGLDARSPAFSRLAQMERSDHYHGAWGVGRISKSCISSRCAAKEKIPAHFLQGKWGWPSWSHPMIFSNKSGCQQDLCDHVAWTKAFTGLPNRQLFPDRPYRSACWNCELGRLRQPIAACWPACPSEPPLQGRPGRGCCSHSARGWGTCPSLDLWPPQKAHVHIICFIFCMLQLK